MKSPGEEAARQGEEYSRRLADENAVLRDRYWDFIRRRRAKWMLRKIREAVPLLAEMRILEVGCGTGFTTFEVARSGAVKAITAIDVSEEALKIARKWKDEAKSAESKKIEFSSADFFTLDVSGEFDCVYMHSVFEHMPTADAVFEKVHNLLKAGGFFMISTPNADRMINRIKKAAGQQPVFIDPFHIKEYTLVELAGERSGWQVVDISGAQLFDEFALGVVLSLGIKRLFNFVYPLARLLTRNSAMDYAGAIFPSASTELSVLYRKC